MFDGLGEIVVGLGHDWFASNSGAFFADYEDTATRRVTFITNGTYVATFYSAIPGNPGWFNTVDDVILDFSFEKADVLGWRIRLADKPEDDVKGSMQIYEFIRNVNFHDLLPSHLRLSSSNASVSSSLPTIILNIKNETIKDIWLGHFMDTENGLDSTLKDIVIWINDGFTTLDEDVIRYAIVFLSILEPNDFDNLYDQLINWQPSTSDEIVMEGKYWEITWREGGDMPKGVFFKYIG